MIRRLVVGLGMLVLSLAAGGGPAASAEPDPAPAQQRPAEPPPDAEPVAATEPEPAGGSRFRWTGDVLLRGEAVRRTPNPLTRDFERVRLRYRPGVEVRLGDRVTFGAGLLASLASDDNEWNAVRFDNFQSDDVRPDRAFVSIAGLAHAVSATFGVLESPFGGTEVVWDRDLRFQGASIGAELPGGDTLLGQRLLAAVSVGSQVGEQSSQVAAARWEGELRRGFQLGAGFWHFGQTDVLVEEGYARTNRLAPGGEDLLSDFEVAHLTIGWETIGAARPVRLRLDLLHNLGADDARTGGELRVEWGELQQAGTWRLRLVAQRVEQDAVPAAFGGDEWWFRTRQRGARLGFAVALGRQAFAEASWLRQRRDDLDEWLDRAILDLIVLL
jgi:hypothetical protein